MAIHERYPEKEYVWQINADFIEKYGLPQPGDIALAICGWKKAQHYEPVFIKAVIKDVSLDEAKRIAGCKYIRFLERLLIQDGQRVPDYDKWHIEAANERYTQLQEIWREKVQAKTEYQTEYDDV